MAVRSRMGRRSTAALTGPPPRAAIAAPCLRWIGPVFCPANGKTKTLPALAVCSKSKPTRVAGGCPAPGFLLPSSVVPSGGREVCDPPGEPGSLDLISRIHIMLQQFVPGRKCLMPCCREIPAGRLFIPRAGPRSQKTRPAAFQIPCPPQTTPRRPRSGPGIRPLRPRSPS